MNINEKIYVYRKKCGLSQEALAEKIGVSRQSVSKWETGDALPEITKLKALAELFGVTTDFLLDDDADEFVKPEPRTVKLNAFDRFELWLGTLPQKLAPVLKKYGWIGGVLLIALGSLRILTAVMSVVNLVQIGSVVTHATSFAIPSMIVSAVSVIFQLGIGAVLIVCGVTIVKRYRR